MPYYACYNERIETYKDWKLESPSAVELAASGFIFRPVNKDDDTVECFLCAKELDGWEPSDSPPEQHYQHSPNCAFAQAVCRPLTMDGGYDADAPDTFPSSALLESAREQTYDKHWPHKANQGFFATPKRLSRAGFFYNPEFKGDDTVSCVYCGINLAGWRPSDNPLVEHKNRTPDCRFFDKIARSRAKGNQRAAATVAAPAKRDAAPTTKKKPAPSQPTKPTKAAAKETRSAAAALKRKLREETPPSDTSPECSRPDMRETTPPPPAPPSKRHKRGRSPLAPHADAEAALGSLHEPLPPAASRNASRSSSPVKHESLAQAGQEKVTQLLETVADAAVEREAGTRHSSGPFDLPPSHLEFTQRGRDPFAAIISAAEALDDLEPPPAAAAAAAAAAVPLVRKTRRVQQRSSPPPPDASNAPGAVDSASESEDQARPTRPVRASARVAARREAPARKPKSQPKPKAVPKPTSSPPQQPPAPTPALAPEEAEPVVEVPVADTSPAVARRVSRRATFQVDVPSSFDPRSHPLLAHLFGNLSSYSLDCLQLSVEQFCALQRDRRVQSVTQHGEQCVKTLQDQAGTVRRMLKNLEEERKQLVHSSKLS